MSVWQELEKKRKGAYKSTESPSTWQQLEAKRNYSGIDKEITSLNNSLTDMYSGWKDADTMKGYASSLSSTLEKVKGYKDYLTKYYGNDTNYAKQIETLAAVEDYFNSATEGVNYLTGYYGGSTNAETFAKRKAKDEAKAAELLKLQELTKAKDFADRSGYEDAGRVVGGWSGDFAFGTPVRSESDTYRGLYNAINKVEGQRYAAFGGLGADINAAVAKLTDDEKALYNYISNTQGYDAGYDYVQKIADTLNYRQGEEIANSWAGRNLPHLMGFVSGVDSSIEGFTNAVNSIVNPNKERATSAMGYAGGLITQREMEEGFWQGALTQVSQSIGQMVPQMVATALLNPAAAAGTISKRVASVVSMSLLGTSVYGNAYNEALQKGQTGFNAYTYGLANAGVEVLAESFADGIGRVASGSWGKQLASALVSDEMRSFTKVVSDFAQKPTVKYFLDALGEGAEEVFSEVMAPVIESITLGETPEPATIEEMLYSGLLGAMSAMGLNLTSIPQNVREYKKNQEFFSIVNDADIDKMRTEALKMDVETDSYKAASKIDHIKTDLLSKNQKLEVYNALAKDNAAVAEKILDDAIARSSREGSRDQKRAEFEEAIRNISSDGDKYTVSNDNKAYNESGEMVDFSDYTNAVGVDEDGNFTFKSKDGSTISSADATLPENVARAMSILSAKDEYKIPQSAYRAFFQNLPANADANAYAATFAEIFEMGQELEGRNLAKMVAKEGVELTEEQKELIYIAGTESRKSANETLNAAIKTARKAAEKNGKFNAKKGKVDTSKIKNMRLSKEQQAAVRLASVFSEFGIDVVIDATTAAERKKGKENGSFNSRTGTLTLDINAGTNEEHLGSGVFWTIAHEVTHLIKATSSESFDTIREFVINEYFDSIESFDRAVYEEQQRHDKKYPNEKKMTRDQAIEEIVARSCESIFRDSEVLARLLAEGEAKEKGFAEKVIDAIKEILEKIVTFFKSLSEEYNPESKEGKFFSENAERTQKLAKIFDQALETALENAKVVYGTENAFEEAGVEFDKKSESASPMFSERTWSESEYVTNRDEAAKNLAEALDVPVEKAKQYIDNVNSIAKAISNDRARLDYQASSFGSAFVSNVEYGGSFDFTTLCKKRRIYTGTFSEIQRRIGEAVLSPEDILEIRNLMLEGGFEATCGLCYVEGSRANMGKFAKKFIELYKRDNPDAWIPKMVDVNTPDGVEQMRINHPEAYEKYEYFWNHYGKLNDSDPALFASQQKPKLYEARKEYKGEILQHFDDVEAIAKKNLKGGIRMQSFSDFEIVHLIDTMQIIMDMAKVGLAGQAYTKVPEFADAFGNTGLKINLSLIAKGVDENGKLIFDDREGMPAETAFKLRNKYSSNVGTIIVAFTDDQVKAAMADPRIDFIIPFHRSQWKKSQYGAMGLPKGTKDYTYVQNEKLIKPTYHEYRGRMVKDKATNFMPNEYWDFSKSGKENAENYLKMCAENNKRPKFYKFLDYDGKGTYSLKKDGSTDGYWKLLIDFKMYDNNGVGAPQTAVTPDFSMDEAMTMLDEYKGGHQKYPIAHGVVDKFVDKFNNEAGLMRSDRITATMSDRERYEILKSKKISAPIYNGEADEIIAVNQKELESNKLGLVKSALVRIADEFNAFTDYEIRDVDVKITLSKSNLKESISKDATPIQLVKLLPLLRSAVENAVGIERHYNRYYYDTDTVHFDNLLGAYVDGNALVPVRFGLKHSKSGKNTLYVVVDQSKINIDDLGKTKNDRDRKDASPDFNTGESSLLSSVTYSIPQIIPFVNTQSKDLLRYIPDLLLSEEQRKAKWEAVSETIKKTNLKNDSKYAEFISKGDSRNAQSMVEAAAKAAGYTYYGYHGTRAKPFTVFKPSVTGVYLATNRSLAEDFATGWRGEKGTIYNLVAKVENPLIVNEHIYSSVPYYWNIPTPSVMREGGYKTDTVSTEEIAHWARDHQYDGVIIKGIREGAGVFTDDIIVFDEHQLKSADPITYDDNGNVIPLSERFKSENEDIRYSDRRPNRDREILAEVLADSSLKQRYFSQRVFLQKYQEAQTSYNKALAEVNRIENEIRQLPRGNTQNSNVKRLQKSLETYYGRLQAAEEKMLEYEAEGLRDVIDSEMERLTREGAAAARQARREAIHERVERASKAAEISTISNYVKKTLKLFEGDTKKAYVPEVLKAPIVEFLTMFDFTKAKTNGGVTQQSARLDDAVKALASINAEDFDKIIGAFEQAVKDNNFGEETFTFDLNEDVVDKLKEKFESIKAEIKRFENLDPTQRNIYNMDAEALANLKGALKSIYTIVKQANTLIASGMSIADAANGTINHLADVEADTGKWSTAKRKMYFSYVDPIRFFGKLGKEAAEMFRQLQVAESRRAFLIKRVQDFMRNEIGVKNVEAWENEIHEIKGIPVLDKNGDIVLDDNGKPAKKTIKLNATQIMALYCHWNREQSRKHLSSTNENGDEVKTGGGIFREKLDSGEFDESPRIRFTQEIVDAMTNELSKEQLNAAKAIQRYMSNELAELGNMVTMKRFGLNGFTEEYYIPIITKKNDSVNETGDKAPGELLRIINKSFTKKTKKIATSTIYIDNLFDVFTKHAMEMIDYHSFAIPLLDIVRWLNFSDTANGADITMKDALNKAFGTQGRQFITQLIKDINGSSFTPTGGIGIQRFFLRNVKVALVGGKMKQMFLQPSAVARASEVIKEKNINKAVGILLKTKGAEDNIRNTYERAKKWSGVAVMKDMGYVDINLGVGTFADIIKDNGESAWKKAIASFKTKDAKKIHEAATELSLEYMRIGDKVGWAILWRACEYEALERFPKLVPKSDEYYKAVTGLFEECVYKTQVFDSVLSKNAMTRSSDTLARLSTSFMSERMKSLQGIIGVYQEYSDTRIRLEKAERAKQSDDEKGRKEAARIARKKAFEMHRADMGKALWKYVVAGVVTAIISTVADAFADDEENWLDYKLWLKKFFGQPKKLFLDGNLLNELDVLRKLPYVSEIVNIFMGYDSSRLDLESFAETQQAFTALLNIAQGKGNYTRIGVFVQALEAVSLMTGLPVQNAAKDLKDILNAIIQEVFGAEWLKEKKK